MKLTEENHRRVKETLAAAYHENAKGEIGRLWLGGVMRHVRSIGPLSSGFNYFEVLEGYLWRLAPVACALIVILGAVFIQTDFFADYELAGILMDDPVEPSLFQSSLN